MIIHDHFIKYKLDRKLSHLYSRHEIIIITLKYNYVLSQRKGFYDILELFYDNKIVSPIRYSTNDTSLNYCLS